MALLFAFSRLGRGTNGALHLFVCAIVMHRFLTISAATPGGGHEAISCCCALMVMQPAYDQILKIFPMIWCDVTDVSYPSYPGGRAMVTLALK